MSAAQKRIDVISEDSEPKLTVAERKPVAVPEPEAKPAAAPVAAAAPKPKGKGLRRLLILLVPLLVAAAGGYYWLTGGRYVTTDNAYVQQPLVGISAQVSGTVVEVTVAENQPVKAGDVLFRIDPEPYQIAIAQADAALAQARLNVEQLRAAYATAQAKLTATQDIATVRHTELDRQQSLTDKGLATSSTLDDMRIAAQAGDNDVALAQQALAAAAAALGGDPQVATDEYPAVRAALAAQRMAARNLAHATVTAPDAGIVSHVSGLNAGEFVAAGATVLSLVERDRTWIEANFKETQLAGLTEGQTVDLSVDAYPGVTLTGRVDSIGSATGAEFSLIPAQNATGNWVKVVQRLPVRISATGDAVHPLRAGMSVSVSVDTGASRLDKLRAK